jgi:hypothetical protein
LSRMIPKLINPTKTPPNTNSVSMDMAWFMQ